jgi:TM2 domain-containing membrane protein YozV
MVLNMEVDELFQAQRQLSEKDFAIYNAELQKKTKNIGLAYFLLIFFGVIGLHKFYIGKVGQGIAYFFISLLYLIVFEFVIFNSGLYWHPTPFFYGFISILSIFLFYDLFTLSKQISEYDKNIRIDLLAQFGIIIPKKENEQKIKFNEKEIIDFFNILSHYANKLIDLIYNLQDSIKIPLLMFSLYEINWFFDLRFEHMFVFNVICTIFVALALILTYSLLAEDFRLVVAST